MTKMRKIPLATAILATSLMFSPLAFAETTFVPANKLAVQIENTLNASAQSVQGFGVYKFLLDMGARANGTKKETSGKHGAWCAKIHKSYDPATNMVTGFNGKTFPCYSPY